MPAAPSGMASARQSIESHAEQPIERDVSPFPFNLVLFDLARYKFLKEPEVDHKAVVELRRRFWNFPDDVTETCVPPVLVYADLLATGDARCMETAKRLYKEHVVRLVRQA